MAYWLLKSEPDAFSWAQQVEHGVEPWTGVRSRQARGNLAAMRNGDLAFFYHSNIGKEIVGVVRVVREAYPDPTADSVDWVCVDVEAVEPVPRPVTLAAIKADPAFADFLLVRQSRLSVVPVGETDWARLRQLGGLDGGTPASAGSGPPTTSRDSAPTPDTAKKAGPKKAATKKPATKKVGAASKAGTANKRTRP